MSVKKESVELPQDEIIGDEAIVNLAVLDSRLNLAIKRERRSLLFFFCAIVIFIISVITLAFATAAVSNPPTTPVIELSEAEKELVMRIANLVPRPSPAP